MSDSPRGYSDQGREDRLAYDRYLSSMDASMRQKVALTAAFLLGRGRVADMGMGSGTGSDALAGLYPELEVIGVDIDQTMVDLATERYRRSNLRFVPAPLRIRPRSLGELGPERVGEPLPALRIRRMARRHDRLQVAFGVPLEGEERAALARRRAVRGLAHRIQELTYGGLKPAYQARLDAMIEGTEKPNGTGRPGRRPRHDVDLLEGTKLLREWRGVTHEVTVIDGGYEHQGKRYRSLSAVARAITGTQWSGPLFFGLRKTGAGSGADLR